MAAHQAPPSLEFSRQEHWSGLCFHGSIEMTRSPSPRTWRPDFPGATGEVMRYDFKGCTSCLRWQVTASHAPQTAQPLGTTRPWIGHQTQKVPWSQLGWREAPRRCIPRWLLNGTITSPLSTSLHSEGDQPWAFFGRNDAKAETPVLWPPHAKS